MSYMDAFGIKKDIVDVLRDYLYPRCTVGNSFYTGMTVNTKYAQSFIPFSTSMNSISIYCNTVGTGLSALTVSVQKDVSGSPSGTMEASVTFAQTDITDDSWDVKALSYTKFISRNKYWLVLESSGQSVSAYYKIGRDTLRTNYQVGIPKESTATWATTNFDVMFEVDVDDWIYPTYPSDTITNEELPRVAVDIMGRRVEERYCADELALANITGLVLVYSQYPDELDKILSYGERGLFIERANITNIDLLTPTAITPIERLREKMYVRGWNFNLRKKLTYIVEVPTVE